MKRLPRVVIDPGHGGVDPGAVNGELGLRESLMAMEYATEIQSALYGKATTMLTRDRDYFVSLPERVRIAKAFKADLFLSVHMNSAENPHATGFEIWTSIGKTKADDIATAIWERIALTFPTLAPRADWSDGDPDKERNYFVLRETPMPAALIELGFICNRGEAIWLSSRPTMQIYAKAIADGVRASFGV